MSICHVSVASTHYPPPQDNVIRNLYTSKIAQQVDATLFTEQCCSSNRTTLSLRSTCSLFSSVDRRAKLFYKAEKHVRIKRLTSLAILKSKKVEIRTSKSIA